MALGVLASMGGLVTRENAQVTEAEGGRLAELYVSHAAEAIRLAYVLTGDRQLAEDLVQDAFVKLAGRLAHLRDPGAFDSYLRRTVVNLTNSYFRRKRLERAYLRRTAAERPVSAEGPMTPIAATNFGGASNGCRHVSAPRSCSGSMKTYQSSVWQRS